MTLHIKVVNQRQSLARRVSLGTLKHHILIMMQAQSMTLLVDTIFAEILEVQKNPFGVTLLTQKLHLNYVSP